MKKSKISQLAPGFRYLQTLALNKSDLKKGTIYLKIIIIIIIIIIITNF